MTTVKASDLLVRALEREGVEYVFGVPGEENLDLLESLRTSSWLSLALRVEGETLTVRSKVDGEAAGDSGIAAFARAPESDEGTLPNLSVPRRIAGISFYRDLHGFYAAKDEAEYHRNLDIMMDSCQRFLGFDLLESTPMSEYVLG